jgi:hypothetical protein
LPSPRRPLINALHIITVGITSPAANISSNTLTASSTRPLLHVVARHVIARHVVALHSYSSSPVVGPALAPALPNHSRARPNRVRFSSTSAAPPRACATHSSACRARQARAPTLLLRPPSVHTLLLPTEPAPPGLARPRREPLARLPARPPLHLRALAHATATPSLAPCVRAPAEPPHIALAHALLHVAHAYCPCACTARRCLRSLALPPAGAWAASARARTSSRTLLRRAAPRTSALTHAALRPARRAAWAACSHAPSRLGRPLPRAEPRAACSCDARARAAWTWPSRTRPSRSPPARRSPARAPPALRRSPAASPTALHQWREERGR